MGFLSKLFGKKDDNNKTGGMEDYMQLVRVYFQASIAAERKTTITRREEWKTTCSLCVFISRRP